MQSKEISIKDLFCEIIKYKLWIIILSLLTGILVVAYCVHDIYQKDKAQLYGSTGELYVKNLDNVQSYSLGTDNEINVDLKDEEASILTALLLSDSNLDNVRDELLTKELNLSIEELRGKIYLTNSNGGAVIEITLVDQNQENASLICDTFLQCGCDYLDTNGYQADVTRVASDIGTVSIEMKDSSKEDGKKFAVVNKTDEVVITHTYIIQKFILGVIIALILLCLLVWLKFIVGDRIIYPDQIERINGSSIMSYNGDQYNFKSVYSSLLLPDKTNKIINVFYYGTNDRKELDHIPINFMSKLGELGKCCILMNYREKTNENASVRECREGCSWLDFNDRDLISVDFNEWISNFTRQYEYIIFNAGSFSNCPIISILSKKADVNVLVIKENTISRKDLQMIQNEISDLIIILEKNKL